MLRRQLRVSAQAERLVSAREHLLQCRLPPSVREWYSYQDSVRLLRRHSDGDVPVALRYLGNLAHTSFDDDHADLTKRGLLLIMRENQGVCHWAVRLDNTDDPEVLVEVDSAPKPVWRKHCRTFSEFIYCRVWDYPLGRFVVQAQHDECKPRQLRFLRAHLDEGPRTYYWPGRRNLRFSLDSGRVLIWNGYGQSDWQVSADSMDALAGLLALLRRQSSTPRNFWSDDEELMGFLKMLQTE
jgi:hypothetical protein